MAKCASLGVPARGHFPVRRIQNAEDFLHEFRKRQQRYKSKYGPQIAKTVEQLAPTGARTPPAWVDELLEFHLRLYLIDDLLSALNEPKGRHDLWFGQAEFRAQQKEVCRKGLIPGLLKLLKDYGAN